MRLINQEYKELDTSTGDFFFFEYNIKERDVFLVNKLFWYDSDKVHWYTLAIGRRTVELPGHLFIMVADISSDSVDWIRVDELVGRDFSTFTFSNQLIPEKWDLQPIQVLRVHEEEKSCQLPFSKNILPVMLGDDRAVFVSENDCYKKTKDIPFPNFL